MKYVLDSSVAFKWVVPEAHQDKANLLRDDYRNATHHLIAPEIFSPEIAHAILAQFPEEPVDADTTDNTGPLTRREKEVLQAVADGRSTTEIGRELFISVKTVKNHLASIYEKLNARDRTQAVLMAVKMGIVKLT